MSFELNRKTISYRLLMRNDQYLVVTIRWPDPIEVRRVCASRETGKYKQMEGGKWQIKTGSQNDLNPFFLDHFVSISDGHGRPIEQDEAEQRRMAALPRIDMADKVIIGSLFELTPVPSETSDLADLFSTKIETAHEYYDLESGENVRAVLTHDLAEVSVVQKREYDRANKMIREPRKRTIQNEEDLHTIQRLYRDRIRSVEGAVIDGAPCEESNKPDWVERIMYPWVQTAMFEDNRGCETANFT